MTHSKHTPGPWWAAKPYDHSEHGAECDRRPPGLPDRYTRIEMPGNAAIFITGEDQTGNAALVEAAPEMLEELKRMERLLALCDECVIGLNVKKELASVRAAIAKAEGK